MNKLELRKQWKSQLPLDALYRNQSSQKIIEHLLARPELRLAKQIAIYAARPSEPDLSALHEIKGLRLFYPYTHPAALELTFHEIKAPTDLIVRTIGLLEPVPELHSTAWDWNETSLVLVPGLAFDIYGSRIGSGAGYYDRFFERFPRARRWAIAFSRQLHEQKLAQTPTDARMDAVVTENGWQAALKE